MTWLWFGIVLLNKKEYLEYFKNNCIGLSNGQQLLCDVGL